MVFLFVITGLSQDSFAGAQPLLKTAEDTNTSVDQIETIPEYNTYFPVIRHPKANNVVGTQMDYISNSGGLSQLADTQSYWVGGAPILWSKIETTRGNYDWSAAAASESQWKNAFQEGLSPIGNVRSTPLWAQLYKGRYCGPMQEKYFSDFAEFMRQLVARYSVPPYNVRYWEIWNEPDVDYRINDPDSQFGCWGKNEDKYFYGRYYGQMLKVVYPAIKSVDPNIQVLVGGLLLDCNPDKPGISCISSKFFEGIVKEGGGEYFDGVSYHAYDYFSYSSGLPEADRYTKNVGHYTSNDKWSSAWNTTGSVMIEKAGYINKILSKYGVTGKFLLNTESALNCSDCNGEIVALYNENPTPAYETTKAYYVTQVYAAAKNLGLRAILWYNLLGWPRYNTGLLNSDLSEREGFVAFRVSSEKLAGVSNLGEISSVDINPAVGIKGYKFARPNQQIWVVWSLDGNDHNVTLQSGNTLTAITDALGVAQPLSTALTITIKPLYIEWIP